LGEINLGIDFVPNFVTPKFLKVNVCVQTVRIGHVHRKHNVFSIANALFFTVVFIYRKLLSPVQPPKIVGINCFELRLLGKKMELVLISLNWVKLFPTKKIETSFPIFPVLFKKNIFGIYPIH